VNMSAMMTVVAGVVVVVFHCGGIATREQVTLSLD
jgi:hypothetical protein